MTASLLLGHYHLDLLHLEIQQRMIRVLPGPGILVRIGGLLGSAPHIHLGPGEILELEMLGGHHMIQFARPMDCGGHSGRPFGSDQAKPLIVRIIRSNRTRSRSLEVRFQG